MITDSPESVWPNLARKNTMRVRSLRRILVFALAAIVVMTTLFVIGPSPASAQKGPSGGLGPLTPDAPPNYGSTALRAGFLPDPFSVQVRTGGNIELRQVDPNCRGFVTAQPDYNLDWSGSSTFLRIYVDGTMADTTLAVRTPGGQLLCNDDAFGTLRSALDFNNPAAGRYNIWVGSYSSGTFADARLYITELSSNRPGGALTPMPSTSGGDRLDFSLPPNYGSTSLRSGFLPDPFSISLTTGGPVNVSYLSPDSRGNSCRGYATAAPDFSVNWSGTTSLLRIYALADRDATLVVNAPDGSWHCNDDRFGLNPGLDFNNPPFGRFDIWVGSYSQSGGAPAVLYITELSSNPGGGGVVPTPSSGGGTRLDFSLPPVFGSTQLRAGFLPDPFSVSVTAGGTVSMSTAMPDCRGSGTAAPTYRVQWSGSSSFLRFYVQSSNDTTLAINTPNGQWVCNDDRFGLQPGIDFNNPQTGQYDIWVGRFGGGTGPATLFITELSSNPGGSGGVAPTPSGGSGQLSFSLPPNYGSTQLRAGFVPDPFSIALTTGGPVNVSYLGNDSRGQSCRGYATSAPDYRVQWSGSSSFLRFYVESDRDSTLVINAPNGQWFCNDDAVGLMPMIDFSNPQTGQYDIWVGSFSSSGGSSGRLFITELRSNQPRR